MSHTIAVGVDGSEPSLVALRWALGAAAARGADLLAVIAESPTPDLSRESGRAIGTRGERLREHLAEVRRAIAETAGGAHVEVETLQGNPTEVLLAVSGRVDLLVVGGHGYKGWRDHFTPSLSGQLAIHTKAAVCVVRAIQEPVKHRILVGHNGENSGAAVRFAIAEAEVRGAGALIVSTWQYPRDTRATSPDAAGILQEGAAAAMTEIVAEMQLAHPGVPIDTVVRLGHPVEVLADLAESADLVVVGSRGRSGLATLVVGSVAIGLLRRLQTPVVIVPFAG